MKNPKFKIYYILMDTQYLFWVILRPADFFIRIIVGFLALRLWRIAPNLTYKPILLRFLQVIR